MYLDFFGLKEQPFSIAPDPRYLYMSERHREALAHLLYGVNGQGGFVVLTGEVGTGKTTICRCFLHQVPKNTDVAYIVNPKLSARELLAAICDELGIEYGESASLKVLTDVLNQYLLRAHADGRHTVLIIDEAQNLRVDVLEQLRLLTNLETSEKKLLQIILLGQPELREILARQELRQLNQRVTARYHLHALNKIEVGAYLQCRLAVAGRKGRLFNIPAVNLMYKLTGGIPRLINLVADRALLGAYADQSEVLEKDHVRQAFNEIQGEPIPGRKVFVWRWPYAFVPVILAIAAGSWFYLANPIEASFTAQAEPPVADGATSAQPDVGAMSLQSQEEKLPTRNIAPAASKRPEPRSLQPQIKKSEGILPPDVTLPTSLAVAEEKETEHPIIEEFKEALTSSSDQLMVYAEAETPDVKPLVQAGQAPLASNNSDFPFLNTLGDKRSSESGKMRAYQAVFERWNVNYDGQRYALACDFAEMNGLRCLHKQGNWRSLLRLDRPAVLTLINQEGESLYLALLRIKEDKAEVDHEGMRFWVSLDEIDRYWLGEYSVIWRLPPYKSQVVRPGQLNESQWLSTHLDRLLLETYASRAQALPTMTLDEKVRTFQRQVGLVPDGIPGTMTIIHMNNLLGLDCPNLLSKS
ncbi:MAG: AAA family ATPase [Oleiphilaceae bacterium]|nr:AAA family ATPase [Oleiphilaceae bacterium]